MKHNVFAYFMLALFLLAPACQKVMEEDVQTEETLATHLLTATLEGNNPTKTCLS